MTAYKKEGRLVYITDPKNESEIHHVPEINWNEYLMLRKEKPKLCKIYNTIEDTKQGAMNEPASHVYIDYTPKPREYFQRNLL